MVNGHRVGRLTLQNLAGITTPIPWAVITLSRLLCIGVLIPPTTPGGEQASSATHYTPHSARNSIPSALSGPRSTSSHISTLVYCKYCTRTSVDRSGSEATSPYPMQTGPG